MRIHTEQSFDGFLQITTYDRDEYGNVRMVDRAYDGDWRGDLLQGCDTRRETATPGLPCAQHAEHHSECSEDGGE